MNSVPTVSFSRLSWRPAALVVLTLAAFLFPPPPPAEAQAASLTTTVNTDRSVDLAITNANNNWWFQIESWGTCTAASGTTVSNIRGYKAGTYSVWAYSDNNCSTQIASASFTITAATLTTTVNTDRSVALTLSGYSGNNWWFRIESWGGCTAASGTTVSNIRGYQTGTYQVVAFTDSNCSFHLATAAFTIPSATLAATVNTDRAVALTLSGGPGSWWFRINGGTCTAVSGTTVSNIRGYAPASYYVEAFSNSGCNYKITTTTFTIPDYAAAPASVVGYRGWQFIDVEWSAVTGATGYDVKYWHEWYGWQNAHSNITGGNSTPKKARITLPANSNVGNYHVAVRAIDANGPGLWKESAAIPSISIVPKASNVTAARATNDNTTINVSWTICDVNATWCNGGTPVTGYLVNISSDGGATWERVKTLTSYTSGSIVTISSSEVTGGIVGDKSYLVEVGIETRFKTTWVRSAPVPHVYQTVSNIDNAGGGPNPLTSTKRWSAPFTTGPHPAGYTLQSVVTPLALNSGSGTLTWKIHTATTADDPTPTDTVQATLTSGGNPTTGDYSNFTQTCSGSGCNLLPDTTYFVVATTSGGQYLWLYSSDPLGTYTANPSNNGWSIGKGWFSDYSNDAWGDWTTWNDVGKFTVKFNPKPTDLPASRGVSGYRGWGFIDAEWSPVTNATSYYVRYRAAQGNHWMTRATRHTGTSIRLGGIPNYWDYIIQVQAINSSGGGAWAESAPVKPVRALQTAASNVQVTRSDGAIAVSWTQCDITQFSCNGGTPITGWAISISENGGTWTRAKDLTSYTSGSAITIDSGIDNTKSYQVHVGVITRFKTVWTSASVPVTEILTVDNLTHNSATLKIINYSGDWYYKRTTPSGDDTCHSVVSGTTTDSLSDLTASTSYTYKAYSTSGCNVPNEIASATFTTGSASSVSSLGNSRAGASLVGRANGIPQKAAAQFTVGTNTGGYDLYSVTIEIDAVTGSPGDLTVAIYSNDANNKPNASQITLSGENPTGAGQYTYTCPTGCGLTANGKYHLVLEAANATGNNNYYAWESSTSSSEVAVPSNNGWEIGQSFEHSSSTWSASAQYVKFKVTATPNNASNSALVGGSASGLSGWVGQALGASKGASESGAATSLPGYVSSLSSAQAGGTQLEAGDLAGVAFTTGPHPAGYTLDSVTATLAALSEDTDLVWTLHEQAGDRPSPTTRATLTGTAPTADEFTDLTYTCAGDGCALAPNTTYFVVAESVGSGVVSWAFIFSSATLSETAVPANNGWSLGHGHYSADGVTWATFHDWQHTRLDFTPR